MPMSRLAAGLPETSLPSMSTSPVSAVSNPATIRSAVVLPQPDGPSSATSSPGAISSDIPSSALAAPKARVSSRSDTLVPSRAPAAWPPAARPAEPTVPAAVATSFVAISSRQSFWCWG